jgi:hypothetical protein
LYKKQIFLLYKKQIFFLYKKKIFRRERQCRGGVFLRVFFQTFSGFFSRFLAGSNQFGILKTIIWGVYGTWEALGGCKILP